MGNLCQQTRAINIGSNLQNAGLLRSLLGQLMALVSDIHLSCSSPWSTLLESSITTASNEALDSFRHELISAIDNCIAAVKEKTRVFQKRVMRKTTTTPSKPSPPVPSISGQGSPAATSPVLTPGMTRFRSELLLSQNAILVPALFSKASSEKRPSSLAPPSALTLFHSFAFKSLSCLFQCAGDSSSSDILGQVHSFSSVDAVSGLGLLAGAGVAAHLPESSSSAALTPAAQSPNAAPTLNLQLLPAPSASSDSDNMPVSPVRHSSARSTPIDIGAPRYVYTSVSILTFFERMQQVSTDFLCR
jgi:hypothetical protein